MGKVKSCLLVLLLLGIILSACQQKQYIIEEYQTKIIENNSDKNVKTEYFIEEGKGELKFEFEEKEIPFEVEIFCDTQTYLGNYKLSGTLGEGNISVLLLTANRDEIEKFTYRSGKLKQKEHFDLYGGRYFLRIQFENAKRGKFKIKFDSL